MNRWLIRKLNIQRDHVPTLLQVGLNINVVRAVQRLKGGASFLLRRAFLKLEKWLWGRISGRTTTLLRV